MKRSALFLLLTGLILTLLSSPAGAAAPLTVQINGGVVSAPADMNIIEGQVMVPLRWAADQLGASSVEWDSANRTVNIKTPQDFYRIEKLASYTRGLQSDIDEQNLQIWPLPDKFKNLQLPDLVPDRVWALELRHFNPESTDLTPPSDRDYITIHIASDDGLYEHSSIAHSIENRGGHYYLPMDWLEYLFKARVNYDPTGNVLSIQTPAIEKITSAIAMAENTLVPASADEAVKLWGRGEQTRNGALQYAALSPQLRQEADKSDYVHKSYWVTGFSSPQVGPITITIRDIISDTKIAYTLTFPEITSDSLDSTATEKIIVEKIQYNGQEGWFITQLLQSSGYGIIDGATSLLDSQNIDIDGDGQEETAQITINNDNQQWELTVKKDSSEAAAEIFKGDNKGFDASIVAAGHIIGPDTIDFLLATDYRSMPFGGCGYELYSLMDGDLCRNDLSVITTGTPFSIDVDENNRSAKIAANGTVTAVSLSDLDVHDYKLYGNDFCQNFFIEMSLQSVPGEVLPKIVTTEVIAAVLPQSLTYLHTTYKYVDGNWEAEK
ncbi:MAG TPA: stalk domain-containing protein, partial [Syntrophomonas sp.]|nr:stalk domain-containing protein [Syntrophomonas sp.]